MSTVEWGVGRLLTPAERATWPDGVLRSAFAVGGGRVLTAWHCVRDIGGTDARIWVRLQPQASDQRFLDVPVRYLRHHAALDAALLVLDETRAAEPGLRARLDRVALPLGAEPPAYAPVRVVGFPELDPSLHAVAMTGTVESGDQLVGSHRVIRVFVAALGARFAEKPAGMSGGPLMWQVDGAERVAGYVTAYPSTADRKGALGGAVLCRHVSDLRAVFPELAASLPALATPAAEKPMPRTRMSKPDEITFRDAAIDAFRGERDLELMLSDLGLHRKDWPDRGLGPVEAWDRALHALADSAVDGGQLALLRRALDARPRNPGFRELAARYFELV
ncbi:effector-associated domain EAD1-containing protein [Actinoplanes derwentensis]|uniref:Trypsin-like peptidase domain-containing protein n=1 Tax=Actinoplanes derwentensis TaxID=113562 RepID=A0A1H2AJ50_9ACTN|nr:effector-associated domain EAD1-containing protein [Actinoplanes derwentensis]GID90237.1 hypothetical protein Ade03nite_91610 [Actinoplanes derwentensis]SDT45566.1 Trypsin-like peptidase domain-containing protein [Actinoplanes derwentensis]